MSGRAITAGRRPPWNLPASGSRAVLFVLLAISLLLMLCASWRPVASRRPVINCSAVETTVPRQALADGLRLAINIPAYRLDVIEQDALTISYPVAVGAPNYPTPRGVFAIAEVEWNPWWIPPPTEWARNETITPPGPANPMGRVKLYFRPAYFIHGTPAVQSIGSAASHGCVRMTNTDAIALARLVVRHGTSDVRDEEIDSLLLQPARTRRMVLAESIRLDVRYDIAEVRRDTLYVHSDIYGLAKGQALQFAILAAAEGLGRDPGAAALDRIQAAVRTARGAGAAVALSDLR